MQSFGGDGERLSAVKAKGTNKKKEGAKTADGLDDEVRGVLIPCAMMVSVAPVEGTKFRHGLCQEAVGLVHVRQAWLEPVSVQSWVRRYHSRLAFTVSLWKCPTSHSRHWPYLTLLVTTCQDARKPPQTIHPLTSDAEQSSPLAPNT